MVLFLRNRGEWGKARQVGTSGTPDIQCNNDYYKTNFDEIGRQNVIVYSSLVFM